MGLTNNEKAALILPIFLAAMIIGVSVYTKHLSSRQQLVNEMIARTNTKINADQEQLSALEDFADNERFQHRYRLDEWIPVFNNTLEVDLFLTQKIDRALSAVNAQKEESNLQVPQTVTTPRIGEFHVQALFPSYGALVEFVRMMEETPPPVLAQEVEIIKSGITIEVTLTFSFGYRVTNEAV